MNDIPPHLAASLEKLPWLEYYRVGGCPDDIIRVEFRRPQLDPPRIIKEEVIVRINSIENRNLHCMLVTNTRSDWNLKKGDPVIVEYYFFERAYHLVCRTLEDKFGFNWY